MMSRLRHRRGARFARHTLLLLGMLGVGPVSPATAAEETVVYANDFNAAPGARFPEWTSGRIRYDGRESGAVDPAPITTVDAPNRKRRFLGEFGGPRVDPGARTKVWQTVALDLKGLAPHESVTVALDLLVLKSWDGNSPRYGSDRWSLQVRGGPILIDTTFSNNPKTAAEGSFQDFPKPKSAPRTGVANVNTLGYEFFGDSTYHLKFTFPHKEETLTLVFSSVLYEGKGTADESWGLDDLRITIDSPQPTPGKDLSKTPKSR